MWDLGFRVSGLGLKGSGAAPQKRKSFLGFFGPFRVLAFSI